MLECISFKQYDNYSIFYIFYITYLFEIKICYFYILCITHIMQKYSTYEICALYLMLGLTYTKVEDKTKLQKLLLM
jgi:hypothetical protein